MVEHEASAGVVSCHRPPVPRGVAARPRRSRRGRGNARDDSTLNVASLGALL
jgi:hypothetical protein